MRNKVVAGTKTLENSLFCKKIQLEGLGYQVDNNKRMQRKQS
jgi:hypothetical protein